MVFSTMYVGLSTNKLTLDNSFSLVYLHELCKIKSYKIKIKKNISNIFLNTRLVKKYE